METQTKNEILVLTPVQVRVNKFLASVYGWMTLGLFVTSFMAFFTLASGLFAVIFSVPFLFYILLFAELGLVIYFSVRINKISSTRAKTVFLVYSALNGITMSAILLAYTGASISSTFMVTAGTFGAMAMYGYSTKRDLTSIGSLAFMSLIGIILASVANIFLKNSGLDSVITYLGVAIFIGLTAYDSQKMRQIGESQTRDSEGLKKAAIQGALALYLDFINLFLFFLRIFGRRR